MPAINRTDSYTQNADDVPTSSVYWTREVPSADLVGWRVQVVYPYSEGRGEEGEEEGEEA